MKSSFELRFAQRPRTVRVLGPAPSPSDRQLTRELEEQAFERGRRQGEKDLSEQLLRQRSELLALQSGVLESLRQVLPQMARECENTLVLLALQAAQKLVAGLPISAEMVEATVREAIARVEDTSEFTILLHASDLELLQRVNSPLLLAEVGGERLHLRTGADVTPGGCVVQTRFGLMDGRRETKLELLRKSLEVT